MYDAIAKCPVCKYTWPIAITAKLAKRKRIDCPSCMRAFDRIKVSSLRLGCVWLNARCQSIAITEEESLELPIGNEIDNRHAG